MKVHVNSFTVSSNTMRDIEQLYFDTYNTTARSLMDSAGLEVARIVGELNPRSICVVCGKGNNGGDGYTAAFYLLQDGFDVCVIEAGEPKTEDAAFYKNRYQHINGVVYSSSEGINKIKSSDCIIDAIFGFGFHGEPKGTELELIQKINTSDCYTVSIDIPSGCHADNAEFTTAVKADLTVALGFLKNANVSYPAYGLCGRIVLANIGFPESIKEEAYKRRSINLINSITAGKVKPEREENSHKGSFGTLALFCGSANMPGAARLAAYGALKCGVGLVNLVADEKTLDYTKQAMAEPVYTVMSGNPEMDKPVNATAYVIGCGYGRDRDDYLKKLLYLADKPVCLDADGINLIADNIYILNKISAEKVLTPHPAEMGRLISKDAKFVQAHRLKVATEFANAHNCVVVLKGARTVIASPDTVYVNTSGSSALAKGGSGDVLAGMVGAFLARGMTPVKAAALAVWMHGTAGDKKAAESGEDSLLPSRLLDT